MGQFASSVKKKDDEPTAVDSAATSDTRRSEARVSRGGGVGASLGRYADVLRQKGVIPEMFLIRERKSGEFVDEDGDVANEFYTEKARKGKQGFRLAKITKNIRPQGPEKYTIPRLHPDFPAVIVECGYEAKR